MKLTDKDYSVIARSVEEGKNYIEYDKGNETIVIECELVLDGYTEDDYYHGTGAFVTTGRDLYVECLGSWNEDGDETENDFDYGVFYDMVMLDCPIM